MATLELGGLTLAVLYVDSTATGANNGSTPADALTALPATASLAGNTAYILRRGVGAQTLTPGAANSAQNLAIIGMPKDTDSDPLYAQMPSEVRTAWGADAAAYAVLSLVVGGTTTTFSGWGLIIHNVKLYTTCTAVQTIFAITISGGLSTLTRVRHQGVYDINTQAATIVAVASATIVHGGITITGKHCRVADCEFHSPSGSTSSSTNAVGNTHALYINAGTGVGSAVVENCIFRKITGNGSAIAVECAALNVRARQVFVRNCTFDMVENCGYSGTTTLFASALIVDCVRCKITNIEVTTRKAGANTRTTTTASVTMPQAAWSPQIVVYNTGTSATYGCDFEIDGVTIDGSGYSWAPSGIAISPATAAAAATLITGVGSIVVKNVVINATQTRYSAFTFGISYPASQAVLIDTCTIHYTAASAYILRCGDSSVPAGQDAAGGIARNITGTGLLSTIRMSTVEIESLTVPLIDTANAIYAVGCMVMYIKQLVLPTTWPESQSLVYFATTIARGAQVFIDTCNISIIDSMVTLPTAASANNDIIYVANNGEAGSFMAMSVWEAVRTTAVNRTGGAGAALHVAALAMGAGAPYRIEIPPSNLARRTVANAVTGKRKVVAYVATKNMTPADIAAVLSVRASAPSGGATATKLYDSAGGYIEVDTVSTWNNDPGVSKYKVVVPINADRAEDIGISLAVAPLASYEHVLYVDPKVDVVA